MASFHLHLHNTHVDAPDVEGVDLPDLATARLRAIDGIRDFLGHELGEGKLDLRGQVDIADDVGIILMSVRFAEAVEIIAPIS